MPLQVLMVEDNPGDVRMMTEAFKEVGSPAELHVARDGAEALLVLGNRSPGHPMPDLILLDLNLPKKSGHEVLAAIKEDERLRLIPVVVLTSSRAREDIVTSYRLKANSYVSKPASLESFISVAQSIKNFWMSAATLPGRLH